MPILTYIAPMTTFVRLVKVRIVFYKITRTRRSPPAQNPSVVGLQGFAAWWRLPAVCIHCIAAHEATCLARTVTHSVWAIEAKATPEVGAAPVPLDLLAVYMPIGTRSNPAVNGRLAVGIIDFVVAAAVGRWRRELRARLLLILINDKLTRLNCIQGRTNLPFS